MTIADERAAALARIHKNNKPHLGLIHVEDDLYADVGLFGIGTLYRLLENDRLSNGIELQPVGWYRYEDPRHSDLPSTWGLGPRPPEKIQ